MATENIPTRLKSGLNTAMTRPIKFREVDCMISGAAVALKTAFITPRKNNTTTAGKKLVSRAYTRATTPQPLTESQKVFVTPMPGANKAAALSLQSNHTQVQNPGN